MRDGKESDQRAKATSRNRDVKVAVVLDRMRVTRLQEAAAKRGNLRGQAALQNENPNLPTELAMKPVTTKGLKDH